MSKDKRGVRGLGILQLTTPEYNMTTLSGPGSRSHCNNTDKPAQNVAKWGGGEDGDRDCGAVTQDVILSAGFLESLIAPLSL